MAEAAIKQKKTYFRKREELFTVLQKVRLWISRNGTLHGLRSVRQRGSYLEITTYCGQNLRIKNSKTSKVSRWLRNKWYVTPCPNCRVPQWKLEKYSLTSFR